MSERTAGDALIMGCGFLGESLLAQLRDRRRVIAVTRTRARHAAFAARGVECIDCDVATGAPHERLPPALRDFHGQVFVLLPPSALPDDACATLMTGLGAILREVDTERAVLVSSTAVFGDVGGGWVDATSAVAGDHPRARKLLEIERAWMDTGLDAHVLRLGGLYGPGRVIGRAAIAAGRTLPGSGDEWLNVVRVEDAAAAVAATATAPAAPRRGLVTDGAPVLRRDYYNHLAALLHKPEPVFAGTALRHPGSRRCSAAATWAALELTPVYADYRAGLHALV